MTGRGRGTGGQRGTQRQLPARLEDPTRRARGHGAAPLADKDEAEEVSKRAGGERAWRCAASSARPRRLAVGGQGAELLPGTGSPGLYTGPWPHPQRLPGGGGRGEGAGGRGGGPRERGGGEAAVRGRGRCPKSSLLPPPPLLHLKVLFCRRRRRRSLQATAGAESASEPEPGRAAKGERKRRGGSVAPSPDLGGFSPDSTEMAPQSPRTESAATS